MQRRRHEVRDHEDEHPTTSTTAVCRPNDRVGVEVRGRGESRLPSPSSPLFDFDAPRRYPAERYAPRSL